MLLPRIHTAAMILAGLCDVVLTQHLDMESRLGYDDLVPDILELTNRQSAAVEAFDFSNPDVVDAELAEWEAKAAPGNEAIPTCPVNCDTVGQDPWTWAVFPDASALKSCNQTQFLDLAVYTVADGKQEANAIRACSTDSSVSGRNKPPKRQNTSKSCIPASEVESKVDARLETSGSGSAAASDALVTAGKQLASHLDQVKPDCDTGALIRFAITADNTVLGVYGGAQAHRQGVTAELLDKLLSNIATNGISEGLTAELCVGDDNGHLGADYIVGVAVSTKDDGLRVVQEAVRHWSNSTCLTSSPKTWANFSLRVPTPINKNTTLGAGNNNNNNNTTTLRQQQQQGLTKRADCRYIRVVQGDGCGSLASKCGISGADFTKYNPSSTLCGNLKEGQAVCCSSGTLPDLSPKPGADGSCASYTVQAQDYCQKIAATNMITMAQLDEYNKNTWGWNGCDEPLWANLNICLSKGSPPMPASVSNAVCGPTVPNTAKPANGSDLASLNPCPLNVCCNVWGQCGLTDDFCIEQKSKSGAPGTSALKNGCVSSCGMDIKKGTPVANVIRIEYFEAWNGNRPCLRSHVTNYKHVGYTHIHWAFANLSTDFKPDVSGLKEEDKFTKNVVSFVVDNGLDGADFDWEYPAAPDIDGVPPGDLQEGVNYAKLLASMRSQMPTDKTVSFAAPASYWYLKQFPIKTIAKTVDYIVYMTYDLHGQWDAGNPWATPGCPTGNCFRLHVNATETLLSLAMITKAEVDPNKVIVGVSSYSRSFHMAQRGCDGPNCLFTGDRLHSEAAKGPCTDTAGYISNAEIEEIISKGGNIKKWAENATDYLVYNDGTEWVSPPACDYDKKFGYFAKAIKQKWDNDLGDFFDQHMDEYMDCSHAVPIGKPHEYRNESIACPPKHIPDKMHAYNIYVIPKDVKQLTKFLDEEYGIDYEWTYGSVLEFAPCFRDCDEWSKMYGLLALKPDFAVPNAKESLSKSIDNIRALPPFYRQTAGYIKIGFFDGADPQDAVDGASVPPFMIQQATSSMRGIYEAGKEIQKKEMENLIITCITAFLSILPGLGEGLAAVSGIAMIARLATVVAEVGGIATGAYDLATNVDNSVLGIFSTLLGFVGLKGALKGSWSDAAALSRGMGTDVTGMGDIVRNGLNKVEGLAKRVWKA
ncbi:hypothetical protein V8F06_011071 [Rhypophila decipiens]